MMKHEHEDEHPLDMDMDAWAEKIDALVAGEHIPPDQNDDLLDLASRVNTALTPYLDVRRDAERRISADLLKSRGFLKAGFRGAARDAASGDFLHSIPRPNFSHRLLRPALLVVALVCCLLLLLGSGAFNSMRSGVVQLWHTSTSLDQLQGISVDSLERPRNGIRPLPLLPTPLPADIQGASYGVITDVSNPNVLVTFVASYHLKGQDMLLYEQPSAVAFPAANAQTVQIGAIQGQLFQDDTGTNALQWYQHGMICQLTSKLPVERLISLASTFQQIKTWELIL